jgi:uncharacterized protein (DUF1015 family)
MVDILPLNGLRYNLNKQEEISRVLAPPYDIISPEQKENLKKQSPYNIVNLTLPDETWNLNSYEHASIILNNWIEKGVLVFDKSKSFYLIEESFTEDGITKKITGFIGLVKIEEYGKGKILRHEKTLPGPKADRLNLLKKCRTNFESIYTLYNDNSGEINKLINKSMASEAEIITDVKYDSVLGFKLWRISNNKTIDKIINLMKEKTLLIADGHHRYETSRLYKKNIENKLKIKMVLNNLVKNAFSPENYIMSLFVASNQKDITIHPVHRAVKFNPLINEVSLLDKIKGYFEIENIKNFSAGFINKRMLDAKLKGKKSLCLYFVSKNCYIITLKYDIRTAYKNTGMLKQNFNLEYENLDVNILHKLLLGNLLNTYEVHEIKFIHTIPEVIENINSRNFDIGFILNAHDIDVVENLSLRGEIMPQKSTYFYPKPCSGLVMYKFDI